MKEIKMGRGFMSIVLLAICALSLLPRCHLFSKSVPTKSYAQATSLEYPNFQANEDMVTKTPLPPGGLAITMSGDGVTIPENTLGNILNEATEIHDIVWDNYAKTITVNQGGFYRCNISVICTPLTAPTSRFEGRVAFLINGVEKFFTLFSPCYYNENPLLCRYAGQSLSYVHLQAGDVISLQGFANYGCNFDIEEGKRTAYLLLVLQ
jgi:hypothetical protein